MAPIPAGHLSALWPPVGKIVNHKNTGDARQKRHRTTSSYEPKEYLRAGGQGASGKLWRALPFRLFPDLGVFLVLQQGAKKPKLTPRESCERPMKSGDSERSFASNARLAQWKSTSFTRKGSQVQVLQRAPIRPVRVNKTGG